MPCRKKQKVVVHIIQSVYKLSVTLSKKYKNIPLFVSCYIYGKTGRSMELNEKKLTRP